MTTVERLFRLWTKPLPVADDDAEAAFGEVYTDPVSVNGDEMSLLDLIDRARALHRAFADLSIEIVETVETADRLAVAFVQRGRHVGALTLPFGELPATGRQIEVRTIDVLTISDGRISAIQVVPDNLGLAMQLGEIQFSTK